MTVPVVLAIAGVIALFLSIWGGKEKIKAKEIEIPSTSSEARLVLGFAGLILLGTSIWLSIPASAGAKLSPTNETSGQDNIITSETPIPTISAGTVLFAENFESDRAQKMSIKENTKIIADETRNKVLDIDNSAGSGYPDVGFGDTSWANYEIDYRVKFVGSTSDSVFLEFRRKCDSDENCQRYIFSTSMNAINLYYDSANADWVPIGEASMISSHKLGIPYELR